MAKTRAHSQSIDERLYARARRDEKGCLVINVASKRGRPCVGNKGKLQLATRYLMEQKLGRVLRRWELICHHCDNIKCIELTHLYVGTAKSNIQDASNRKRIWNQLPENSLAARKHATMASHANRAKPIASHQKILPHHLPEIIRRREAGETYLSIAKDYGVHPASISKWIRGKFLRSRRALAEYNQDLPRALDD